MTTETRIKKIIEEYKDSEALFYLNMTDGLEALPILQEANIPMSRIRFSSIQSTHLEQKNLDFMLNRLGPDFLMNLALNRTCIVIDFGTDKTISRAIYQGIPFIKYCLEKIWFDCVPDKVIIQAREYDATYQNVTDLYARWFHNLNRRTKSYLRRFKKYANINNFDNTVKLLGISQRTTLDGKSEYYIDIVKQHFKETQI